MFNWIFLGAIALIAGLSILVGVLKAKKYVWQFSLAKTITVVVSIVLSVILSVVLARVLAKGVSIDERYKDEIPSTKGVI